MKVKAEIETFERMGMKIEGEFLAIESHPSHKSHNDLILINFNGQSAYVLASELKKAIASCTGLA